jgi:hypothetical protein
MTDNTFYLDKAIEFIKRVGGVEELMYSGDWRGYNNEDYTVDSGASKVVLVFTNSDYVVKIPFKGEFYEYDDYDCEDSCRRDCPCPQCSRRSRRSVEENCNEFTGARIGESEYSWDYCASEQFFYEKAVVAGVEEFFIKTILIGEFDGHPIYLQEKVEVYGYNSETKSSEQSKEIFIKKFYYSEIQNEDFGGLLIEYYGEDRVNQLVDFLSEAGISDLHSSNVGIRANRPVLFDYSGYRS